MDWSELVETLQNMMVSRATGGSVPDREYKQVREHLLLNQELAEKLPRFARTCRDPSQFWGYIKQYPSYYQRREHIWDGFRPALESLKSQERSPADDIVEATLAKLDIEFVSEAWKKALDRRSDDPEGAITSARTLLETVCKCILDDLGTSHDKNADLPRLYRLTAQSLNLAPDQQSQQIVRRMLGSCQSVVESVGALRNVLSDSHGKGKESTEPLPRHAELAVNLAGSMATFLVATWETQKAGQ